MKSLIAHTVLELPDKKDLYMERTLLVVGILLIGFWGLGLITFNITPLMFHSLVIFGVLIIIYEIYRTWRKKR